jgi:hypothetical protein
MKRSIPKLRKVKKIVPKLAFARNSFQVFHKTCHAWAELMIATLQPFILKSVPPLSFMKKRREFFKVEFIQESDELRQCATEIHVVSHL